MIHAKKDNEIMKPPETSLLSLESSGKSKSRPSTEVAVLQNASLEADWCHRVKDGKSKTLRVHVATGEYSERSNG